METPYTREWFKYYEGITRSSAQVIVPLVMDLIRPKSVVDVGCGTGVWLSEFVAAGITDYLGFDGNWIDCEDLFIPFNKFGVINLTELQKIPPSSGFDLVVCLEVAEHIAGIHAPELVQYLTNLTTSHVLFSAATPGQGGTDHVNEQPHEYWQELFAARGYVRSDPIRPLIADNELVARWYRNNIFVFTRAGK